MSPGVHARQAGKSCTTVVRKVLLDAPVLTLESRERTRYWVSGERAQVLDRHPLAALTVPPVPQVPKVGDPRAESPEGPAGCGLDRAICAALVFSPKGTPNMGHD